MNYGTKTSEEIHTLAQGIRDGSIFCDRMIRPGDERLISQIFLVLALISDEQRAAYAADPPGMLYAPMAVAGPRAINGYPMFMEVQMISQADTERVLARVKQIEESMAALPPA